ncbi:MAG TPA: DUF882 domain-containing protein [Xanthobacteraceae bacterium]|nr:DUF882 domain-containing protein [Xanthobacteraceae bacterium]
MKRRQLLKMLAVAAATSRPVFASTTESTWRLDLINAHTGETFSGPFRDKNGPLHDALHELSWFLRDFHCGAQIPYDVAVLDFLNRVMAAVGVPRATVLSAYRTPETNALLAKTTFGVAEHSQHMFGRALDVYLPNRLEQAVEAARSMRLGGVGWYPDSGFIHLDSGPVRNWDLRGHGFSVPLLDHETSPWFHEPIGLAPDGALIAEKTGKPVTIADRLSLHRLLDKTLGLNADR